MRIIKKYFILILLFLIVRSIYSQQYFTKSYTIENGLPTRYVLDINQDKTGLMWFATYSGVSSYDGFSFKNYDSTDGLPEQNYRKLKFDKKDILWIVPFYVFGTVVYYENNVWNKIKSLKREAVDYEISSFDVTYIDGKPVLCIGSNGGLYVYQNDECVMLQGKSDKTPK